MSEMKALMFLFLAITLASGVLGLLNTTWMDPQIAWVLFVVFLVLFVVSLFFWRTGTP